ncbi:MAG: hypothetical protein AABM29_09720 [Actinomycetota bacterium]
MFDASKRLSRRMADAADLMIDFATLGEYGLEPVDSPDPLECTGGRRRRTPRRLSGSSTRAALAGTQR